MLVSLNLPEVWRIHIRQVPTQTIMDIGFMRMLREAISEKEKTKQCCQYHIFTKLFLKLFDDFTMSD